MQARPAAQTKNRRAHRRLALDQTEVTSQPLMIPTRYLKFLAGVMLLPLAWILTQTFFLAFHRVAVEQEFWRTEEFWFFSLGSALWVLWFIGSLWSMDEPRPLRVYVYGHELTHAVWVWMWQGRISEFRGWSRDGGYVVTDTHNFWIALAPYFYPIYSFVVVLIFAVASFFADVSSISATFLSLTPLQWFFLALGVTWSFHLTFTLWMIPKGQTDLTYHGTFFSLVIIYTMNVLLLSLMLIMGSGVTFAAFGSELLKHAEVFFTAMFQFAQWLRQVLLPR